MCLALGLHGDIGLHGFILNVLLHEYVIYLKKIPYIQRTILSPFPHSLALEQLKDGNDPEKNPVSGRCSSS